MSPSLFSSLRDRLSSGHIATLASTLLPFSLTTISSVPHLPNHINRWISCTLSQTATNLRRDIKVFGREMGMRGREGEWKNEVDKEDPTPERPRLRGIYVRVRVRPDIGTWRGRRSMSCIITFQFQRLEDKHYLGIQYSVISKDLVAWNFSSVTWPQMISTALY